MPSQWPKLKVATQLMTSAISQQQNHAPQPGTSITADDHIQEASASMTNNSGFTNVTQQRPIQKKNTIANLLKKASSKRQQQQPPLSPSDILPDRLKIFIGTWNMYGRLLPIDLGLFLTDTEAVHNDAPAPLVPHLDASTNHPYHLLAIGTQECERDISEALIFPSKEVWERRLQDFLGPSYELLKTETLAALHLAIFVWKPVAHHVQAVQCDRIKTGWANMVGNKGAVAISVLFGSRSLLFINCHLRAHQTKVAERNANVERILHELRIRGFDKPKTKKTKVKKNGTKALPKTTGSLPNINTPRQRSESVAGQIEGGNNDSKNHGADTSLLNRFDHVFLFGDTNYRIDADRHWVIERAKKSDFKALLQHDQLTAERQAGKSPIAAFNEHPINFPPTYKLDAKKWDEDSDSSSSSSKDESDDDDDDDDGGIMDWFHSSRRQSTAHTTPTAVTSPTAAMLPSTSMAATSAVAAAIAGAGRTTSIVADTVSAPPLATSRSPPSSPGTDNLASDKQHPVPHRSHSAPFMTTERRLVSPAELCYDPSPKQRVPSWTDRILWHDRIRPTGIVKQPWWKLKRPDANSPSAASPSPSQDTVCWWYSAVLDKALVGISDHMPVIGVFGIWFDEWVPRPDQEKPAPEQKTKKRTKPWWKKILFLI